MFVVKRSIHNPILSPFHQYPWEDFATFNWSAIVSKKDKKTIHCVYRAMAEPDLIPKTNIYLMRTCVI